MIRIRRHDRRAIARRQIEIRQGDSEMNGYYHPDIELEMEKAKRREFYQEVERMALAKEVLHDQPGWFRTAVNQVVSLFNRFEKRADSGHAQWEKPVGVRDPISATRTL